MKGKKIIRNKILNLQCFNMLSISLVLCNYLISSVTFKTLDRILISPLSYEDRITNCFAFTILAEGWKTEVNQ